MISSAETWPNLSLVACMLELRPLLNFVPAWERLRLLRLRVAESLDQPSIADCFSLLCDSGGSGGSEFCDAVLVVTA